MGSLVGCQYLDPMVSRHAENISNLAPNLPSDGRPHRRILGTHRSLDPISASIALYGHVTATNGPWK